ncbi:MAG: hypothetical protein AMXMBFR58_36300 [Phycisphaerae bacterium]
MRVTHRPKNPDETDPWSRSHRTVFRLTCGHCGRVAEREIVNRDWAPQLIYPGLVEARATPSSAFNNRSKRPESGLSASSPSDPAFGLPLWLVAPCRGHTLWFFNLAQLEETAAYVAAKQRQGSANASLLSRLPRWMVGSEAREDVLATIQKLREK